jgi:hypothetical protein
LKLHLRMAICALHTEIANTDLELDRPYDRWSVRSFVIFAISVWMASFCSDLHTEIAKVAKTDLELEEATIGGRSRSFVIFAISVWMKNLHFGRPEAVRKTFDRSRGKKK